MSEKIEPCCYDCGGNDIIADATAQWNVETQEWELCDVNDASFCSDCDACWSNRTDWRVVKEEKNGIA
jgi:hypothetical protein